MTRDDIIKLAREACEEHQDPFVSGWITMDHDELERFAALVAAAEREAVLKMLEDCLDYKTLIDVAKEIRARSNP